MNFLATAELISQERDLLGRIQGILGSSFIQCLGEARIQAFQSNFLEHLDALAQAEEEWKLGPEALELCLEHLKQVSLHSSNSPDLEVVRQAEETLCLIGEIDDLLRPFAPLEGEDVF